MADSIGAETFLYVHGSLHAPSLTVDDISSRGRDGNAFRRMSKKSSRSTLQCFRDIGSKTAAHALRTTYAALRGTIVTIVQQGISYPNILIEDVRVTGSPVPFANAVGGIAGGTWGVYSEWDVIYAGTP